MVLFADKYDDGNNFYCQKSMAPKSIVKMANTSSSSASRIEYEAGWISANTKSQSPKAVFPEFGSGKGGGRDNDVRSVPVLIDTRKEASSTVSAMPLTGDDGFVQDSGVQTISQNDSDHGISMKLESIQIIAGSVDGGTHSSNTAYERLVADDPENDSVPMVHELGETKLEYNRCFYIPALTPFICFTAHLLFQRLKND